jgi:hypothetical protein
MTPKNTCALPVRTLCGPCVRAPPYPPSSTSARLVGGHPGFGVRALGSVHRERTLADWLQPGEDAAR